MTLLKTHIKIALGYFILAAVLGVLLRSYMSFEIPANYRFIVHTHSHIALLGWVYVALTTLIYRLFVQSPAQDIKYRNFFWFTQMTLIGMLLTFPFQGYALYSIIFSTLFLFASYWSFWFFGKYAKPEFKKAGSYKCIKAALWYLVLSSLGPWALGAIMNILGPESVWYRLAIYFYLHFLYNGWMMIALLGLFLYILEQGRILFPTKNFQRFFWSINLGVVLSFFLSTLFAEPPMFLYVLGGAGAVFQLFALILLFRFLFPFRKKLHSILSKWQWNVLKTVMVLLFVKMVLQWLTAFPYFANLAATFLDFTIGYLHWTFLGVVTISLFLVLDYFDLLKISKSAYRVYIVGFLLTEGLIFYKGWAAWLQLPIFDGYFELLAAVSLLVPIGLILIGYGKPKTPVLKK